MECHHNVLINWQSTIEFLDNELFWMGMQIDMSSLVILVYSSFDAEAEIELIEVEEGI